MLTSATCVYDSAAIFLTGCIPLLQGLLTKDGPHEFLLFSQNFLLEDLICVPGESEMVWEEEGTGGQGDRT